MEADKTRVGQIVRKLLANAFKFTATGGLVKVCVSTVTADQRAVELASMQTPPTTEEGLLSRSLQKLVAILHPTQPTNCDDAVLFLRIQVQDFGMGITKVRIYVFGVMSLFLISVFCTGESESTVQRDRTVQSGRAAGRTRVWSRTVR